MTYYSLSNSSMDRLAQCPLSYYHNYINPEKPKQEDVVGFYADYGVLNHFFAEFYPRTAHFPDMEWKDAKEREEDTISNILDSYGNYIMEHKIELDVNKMMAIYDELMPSIEFPDDEKRTEYYDQGKSFIERLPGMDWSKVVGIEKYFKLYIEGINAPLTGLIDLVERDEKGLIVTDYKTSKPYSVNATLKKNQLPMYGIACYYMYGEFPYKYRYNFTRFDKVVEVEIPEERLKQVFNIIRFKDMQIRNFLNSGNWPAQYQSFYCNNFCGYSRLCPTYKNFNPEV